MGDNLKNKYLEILDQARNLNNLTQLSALTFLINLLCIAYTIDKCTPHPRMTTLWMLLNTTTFAITTYYITKTDKTLYEK